MRNGPVSHPLPRQRMILFCTQAWMRNWPSLERMEHMTTSNERIASTGKNIQEKANLIWNVANTLFGAFKPHEYGLVILPMAVIKRFHDCLLPTHQAVLDKYKEVQHLAVKEGFLCAASGYQFYNISPFTFETLKADPEKISAVDMGYIFENLVQRFSESYNEEAGAHFTSRDIIYLMCDLLVSNAKFDGDGISKTVYDMTMGTSQMLTCMEERLKQLDADADVTCFGQELNPFTFGIAKADMLIRGGDPDNMQFGNTLDDDKFSGYQFDYEISNPPFGIDWKREAPKVEAEHKKGGAGRFGPGLPSKSDGQMLFMLNGLAKLKPDGRMAIIQNGSSLFTGDAGSGQSEIRRYLIENDWLDAIVQLPNDSFYNTGIATYIWIITKDKPEEHIGKVQLIDASKCYEPRRKSIGNKRVDITDVCRELIVKAYGAYADHTYQRELESGAHIICKSRVLDSVSLGYNKIVVETPEMDENGQPVRKRGKPVADTSKRDTENVPLDEDMDAYLSREVLPYNPHAWIDRSKTKVGYEIPFTRTFYEYKPIEPAAEIAKRIEAHEQSLMQKLHDLFGKDGE